MIDTLNRRSRYKRQPSGRNVQITNRDLDILTLMYRYRYLTSQDLIAFFKPKSSKRFTERLGKLFHDAGLLDRPKEQWERAGAHYAHSVYELSSKGKRFLLEKRKEPLHAVIFAKDRPDSASPQFKHVLRINQVILEAELETLDEPHQRFVSLGEIQQKQLAKGKEFKLEFPVTIPISKANLHTVHRTTVKPDGLYGIEYFDREQKLYRFFAVEVELSSPAKRKTLKNSSSFKKQLAYDAATKSGSYKSTLGVPNLQLKLFRN